MKKPILIGGGVVLMAVLIAGGIYLLVPNIPQATSVVGTTDTPEVSPMIKILTSSDIPTIAPTDLRTYTSPEKDISFNYQSKLGQISVLNSKNDTSTDKFFYTLKFKNSALTIEYFDYVYDGFGSTLSTEKVTAKNGQICDVSVFNSSDVSKTIGAFCNYGEANSIAIVVDNLTSQADVDANLLVVEQIVSSLDFNLFPIGHVTPTVLRAVPTIPVGNTNIFTSKKYTVSFKYPKSLGLATTSNDSAGNEVVSFTNSKVNVIYPNFDMGPGAGSIYYNLNTKDGKTFEIEQYSDNTDSKPNSIFAYCISSLTSSNGSVVLTLYNQSNLADDELIIEQIISNLTYTF